MMQPRTRLGLLASLFLYFPVLVFSQVLNPPPGSDGGQVGHDQRLLLLLREEALLVEIQARVKDSSGELLWQSTIREVTVFGKKVRIRINAQNVTVEAEFTPYTTTEGGEQVMLIAQGQTWVTDQGRAHYQSAMRSTPITLGEPIYFYPLGINLEAMPTSGSVLEIEVLVKPLAEALHEPPPSPPHSPGLPAPPTAESGPPER